jgi:hypothetical protein
MGTVDADIALLGFARRRRADWHRSAGATDNEACEHDHRRRCGDSGAHLNGLRLDHLEGKQQLPNGVRPKEFTASEDPDPWIGGPWRRSMPAHLEAIAARDLMPHEVDHVPTSIRTASARPSARNIE